MNTLANQTSLDNTVAALEKNGFKPVVVSSKEEALKQLVSLIPAGASVMNGASETLREIGYTDLLKSQQHGWNNLHEVILAEADQAKQGLLRRTSVVSDFYMGSVHALTETGEMMIVSNTGSQLPHLAFTSPNCILVVGANKIVPTIQAAFERVEKHVIPLEDVRLRGVYGVGTTWAKTLILHKENPFMGRNVHVIIVNEQLGF